MGDSFRGRFFALFGAVHVRLVRGVVLRARRFQEEAAYGDWGNQPKVETVIFVSFLVL